MLVLGALQVLVMNHIHFMGYGSPLVYGALLVYIPVNGNRVLTLLWAFLMGFLVDTFSGTPGLSSASITLAAMVQPVLLKAQTPKDALEDMTPNYRTMGTWNHIRYFTVLLFIHHAAYHLLESFSFFNIQDLLISAGISFGLSWLIIAVLELFRTKK